MPNIGSIGEQVFGPESMEWEESVNEFLTGLLAREGGGKRVRDTGGWTRYGISEKTHGSEYVIWDLTENEAREIYKEQYIPDSIDRIGKNNVAFKFIDMNVNMGWGNATSVLQKALGIKVDGKFGSSTVTALKKAIDKWGEDEVIDMLSKTQLSFYDSLRTSDQDKYGRYGGWDERAKYNPIKE